MERARTPEPIAATGEPDELTCAATAPLVHRFLAGDEDALQRTRVRTHLAHCANCREHYHASVETMVRLARAPQAYRDGLSRVPRALYDRVSGGRAKTSSARRLNLVKLVLPAFGLYAALVMSGRAESAREVRISALGGIVRVGEHTLGPDDGATLLERSQGGSTDAASRARIEADDALLLVEPSTAFAMERLHPLRVRLFEGSFLFEGSSVVSTPAGILETKNASGVIRVNEREIEIAVSNGEVGFQDPRGRMIVRPGLPLRVDLGTRPPPPR